MAKLKDRVAQYSNWVKSGEAPGLGQLKRQQDHLIANRPKYEVQDEAYDNVALAKGRAFGKDRGIQMAEENVDRDIAANIGQAKNISSNTGSILDTLRSLSVSGGQAKRGLAMDEAQMLSGKMGELYGANAGLAEEKDKAWNYNTNMPYQLKIQANREKRKARQEMLMKAMDLAGTLATGGLSSMGGGGGKGVTSFSGGPQYDPYGGISGYDVGRSAPIDESNWFNPRG